MENQSHYRLQGHDGCDIDVTDQYLAVNCVGVGVLTNPFTTWRKQGRRDYYLIYLGQGELDIQIEGQVRTIQPGHLVIYPPGCNTWYAKHDQSEFCYYWVHFSGYGVRSVLEQCALSKTEPAVYFAGYRQELTDCFKSMFQNFIYRDACCDTAAAAQLAGLLVQARRCINDLTAAGNDVAARKISKSLNYIHRHYSQMITVRSLAEIEHLSVSRYRALFRQCMGVSPQAFMINLRLQMATELMMKTDFTLKQIARTVGYEDQLYFSRLFKARKGMAPRQYLQKL